MIAVPMWYAGEFKGLIAGIFDSREFADYVFSDDAHKLEGYSFAVSSGGADLYGARPSGSD
jgi:hypothetical protein